MQIRSITCGLNVEYPVAEETIRRAGTFLSAARKAFIRAGLPVQTVRLATQPFPEVLGGRTTEAAVDFARQLESLCVAQGIDYCSIGPVVADASEADLAPIARLPDVIRGTDNVFASVMIASRQRGPNLAAIGEMARVVADVAHTTDSGFGNLRLAALANCPPNSPFFPVSFHHGAEPAFAIATQAADLAVTAFEAAGSLAQARANLVRAVEDHGARIAGVARRLAAEHHFRFTGIDFSLAPFPTEAHSIGAAIERLGVDRFGANGTLFAAAFLTETLERADFPRCGFSGLMLPVLEDAVLAERSQEGLYTVDSLLLYSAVCGTGLDTIPLPGDVSVDELAAILLDVAALAVRLDKPLTARLMPIPGKRAGDLTDFSFAYFANGRVMEVRGMGCRRVFERGDGGRERMDDL